MQKKQRRRRLHRQAPKEQDFGKLAALFEEIERLLRENKARQRKPTRSSEGKLTGASSSALLCALRVESNATHVTPVGISTKNSQYNSLVYPSTTRTVQVVAATRRAGHKGSVA
jgi:hypothetical protein